MYVYIYIYIYIYTHICTYNSHDSFPAPDVAPEAVLDCKSKRAANA